MKNEKIKGIKKICGMSKSLNGLYDPRYLALYYDISENRVFAKEIVSLDHNSWMEDDAENIYYLDDICEPVSMVDINEIVYTWKRMHPWIFYPMEATKYLTHFSYGSIVRVEKVYTKDGRYFIYGQHGLPIDVTDDQDAFIKTRF